VPMELIGAALADAGAKPVWLVTAGVDVDGRDAQCAFGAARNAPFYRRGTPTINYPHQLRGLDHSARFPLMFNLFCSPLRAHIRCWGSPRKF